MKQTIAELGIGGEGWIVYDNGILSKRVVHVEIVGPLKGVHVTLMPEYILREHIESNGVQTTRDLIVFANHTIYSTKDEADKELIKEISTTITSTEQKSVDHEKLLSELEHLQKQFIEVIEDQKKDFFTFIKDLKNIANPQPYTTDWNQVRINAAIGALNALLETTNHNHSVLGKFAVKDTFIESAVEYADKLVYELKRGEAYFEEKLKEI